jgi:hypothetical protein
MPMGPESSGRLWLPDSVTSAREGGRLSAVFTPRSTPVLIIIIIIIIIIYLQHVPLQCNTTCSSLLLITAVYYLYLVELYRFH